MTKSDTSCGWLKVFRKCEGSEVFANDGVWKLWCLCLFRASHTAHWTSIKTGRGSTKIQLQPGQLVFGRSAFAKVLNANPNTVYKRLKVLEKMGNVTTQPLAHYTVVTVVRWRFYQFPKAEGNTQVTGKLEKSNTQTLSEKPPSHSQEQGLLGSIPPESNTQVTGKLEKSNTYKKGLKKRNYSRNSNEFRLGSFLLSQIRDRKSDFKEPDLQKWAYHIGLMIRIDGRKPERIAEVIEWCQADAFWRNVILSTVKLRKQFDQLELKIQGAASASTTPLHRGADGRTPAEIAMAEVERQKQERLKKLQENEGNVKAG
jgi:DNA-binding transcriptional regulator YhcF (GntR family)